MLKKWVILVLMAVAASLCFGQDAHFSRFYSNSLYLAPSFAGSTGKNRIAMSYRNQWPEVQVGYKTFSVSFDHHFEKLNSGVGILAFNDVAGSGNLSTTNLGLLYSFDFKVTPLIHIRPGMSFVYTQRGIDFNRLLWSDQMSAGGNAPVSGEVPSFNKAGDLDFSASLITYGDNFWGGFTFDHLLGPNQSLYYNEYMEENLAIVPIKFQAFGGVKLTVNETLLRPIPTVMHLAFLYKQQAEFKQLDLGFYYHYNPLVLGVWYRGIPIIRENNVNDAVILLVGLKTNGFNIGYSYDFTVSKLITSTGGAHEVSVSYTFGKAKKTRRRPKKMVPCPEF